MIYSVYNRKVCYLFLYELYSFIPSYKAFSILQNACAQQLKIITPMGAMMGDIIINIFTIRPCSESGTLPGQIYKIITFQVNNMEMQAVKM